MDPDMKELFAEAEANGLWFHSRYQDLWFSPDQLRVLQSKGQFNWGSQNWTLRDPEEMVAEAEKAVIQATETLDRVKRMVRGKEKHNG